MWSLSVSWLTDCGLPHWLIRASTLLWRFIHKWGWGKPINEAHCLFCPMWNYSRANKLWTSSGPVWYALWLLLECNMWPLDRAKGCIWGLNNVGYQLRTEKIGPLSVRSFFPSTSGRESGHPHTKVNWYRQFHRLCSCMYSSSALGWSGGVNKDQ